ncbi:MAG: ADP-glyceromanno-heptose 6-epimerase [Elusimicrobiota bacterium]
MRRALVTGGAGFIGSNIARELERRGLEVVVVDDFRSSRFENLRGYKGDVVAADLRRMEEWAPKVGAVDVIFHEGAITDTTVMDQKLMMEVNVDAFRNLLDFAAATGVRRVVYASSAGVYGAGSIPMREGGEYEPMNIYGFSKKVMEVVAARFSLQEPGIPVVGLRYFNVYGPGEAYKDKAASMIWQLYLQMKDGRRPRIFKSGEQFRDQIYVKDVVEANMKAAQAEHSGVYNVCTGKPATFNKIVEVLNGVLRTSLAPDYFDNPYSFFQSQTQGDPSAAEKGLGFAARYGIEEGIQDYLGGR